jgi:hypothetical protein
LFSDSLCNILIERLDSHFRVEVKDRRVHDNGSTLTFDNIIRNDLIGARVIESAIVVLGFEDMALNSISSHCTCVKLENKILLNVVHARVFIKLSKYNFRAHYNLSIDDSSADVVLFR